MKSSSGTTARSRTRSAGRPVTRTRPAGRRLSSNSTSWRPLIFTDGAQLRRPLRGLEAGQYTQHADDAHGATASFGVGHLANGRLNGRFASHRAYTAHGRGQRGEL